MLAKIKEWSLLVRYWWREIGRGFWQKNRLIIVSGALIMMAVGLRSAHLMSVPFFVQEDELVYDLNGRFLWLTGKDLTGTWSPWSLSPIEPWFNELTAPTLGLIAGWAKNGFMATRVMTGITGLGLVGVTAGISYELTKSKKVSWWVGVLGLFNPWMWQISRTSFDCLFSFFFYAVGGWLFLHLKKWQKLWSIGAFFVGFYQYQGYKLILWPWTIILGGFMLCPYLEEKIIKRKLKRKSAVKNQKSFFKILEAKMRGKKRQKVADKSSFLPVLVVVVLTGVLTGYYALFQLPNENANTRSNTILSPNNQIITEKVETWQNSSLPSWSKKIFFNRYSLYLATMADRYLNLYSPRVLFWEVGESGVNNYWVWYAGSFYMIDMILIGAGIYCLIREKKWRLGAFLGMLVIIAPLPALLNGHGTGEWWLHRGSFRILPLLILAGIGVEKLWTKLNYQMKTGLVLIYIVSVAVFAGLYFYRLPMTSAVPNKIGIRLANEYVRRLSVRGEEVEIYHNDSQETYFRSYLFYNSILDAKNAEELQARFREKNYSWQETSFVSACFDKNIVWSGEENESKEENEGQNKNESREEIIDENKSKNELIYSPPLKKTYLVASGQLLCESDDKQTSVNRDWAVKISNSSGRRLMALQSVAGHSDLFYVWGDQLCGENDELAGTGREITLDALNLEKLTDAEFCHYYLAEI